MLDGVTDANKYLHAQLRQLEEENKQYVLLRLFTVVNKQHNKMAISQNVQVND